MDLSIAFDSLNHQLFADDNTLYACDMSLNVLVEKLGTSAKSVIQWLENNYMKLNESKCKILISGKKKRSDNSITW